jgi:hypothetical protein
MPHETSIMNTSSDITNIENDPEVIFVHALNRSTYILNNPLLVFSHFRKCIVGCILYSVGTLSLVKYPVLIKLNILLLLY